MPGEYPKMCSRVLENLWELPIKLIGILALKNATQLKATVQHSWEVDLSTTVAYRREAPGDS